jgi:hypothetical protein
MRNVKEGAQKIYRIHHHFPPYDEAEATAALSASGASSSFELTARAESCSTEAWVASVVVGRGTFVTASGSVSWSVRSSSSDSSSSSSRTVSWGWPGLLASSGLRAHQTYL